MTIDDAPSVDMKQKVDVLVKHNIPCVWFCQGSNIEERPELAMYALQQGHIIANHSYSHPNFSRIPLADCLQEIDKTDAIIQKIYDDVGLSWTHKFFRFPHGDKGDLLFGDLHETPTSEGQKRKDALQAYLRLRGYSQPDFNSVTNAFHRSTGMFHDVDWRWTFDVMEYAPYRDGKYGYRTMEEIFQRMDTHSPEDGLSMHDASTDEIILVHDMPETAEWFQEIVEKLCQKNMEFTNVKNLVH